MLEMPRGKWWAFAMFVAFPLLFLVWLYAIILCIFGKWKKLIFRWDGEESTALEFAITLPVIVIILMWCAFLFSTFWWWAILIIIGLIIGGYFGLIGLSSLYNKIQYRQKTKQDKQLHKILFIMSVVIITITAIIVICSRVGVFK